jgi:hypothetical protein
MTIALMALSLAFLYLAWALARNTTRLAEDAVAVRETWKRG